LIVLDTNVVSELMRPQPDLAVLSWLAGFPLNLLFTTAITRGEILFGIKLLPAGKRRKFISDAAQDIFESDFDQRVLAFDSRSSVHFASISAERRRLGRPIAQLDAQIAAIAKSHGATLSTRNIADFELCDIKLQNPWKG
jgi:predicted nucleic acid-binding protein